MTADWKRFFIPGERITRSSYWVILALWLGGIYLWAITGSVRLIPDIGDILGAYPELLANENLAAHFVASLLLSLEAIWFLTLFSFTLAWLSVLPAVKPLAALAGLGRFSGFVGVPVIFTLWLRDAHTVKIALLVLGAGVFTVPSVIGVIQAIPQSEYDYARTLRMSEWRTLYEVTVRSRLDISLEALITNAAMVWMLVPMVEMLFRYEGGVGALMADENKHMNLAAVYALTLLVLVWGAIQEWCLYLLRDILCPFLKAEKR